jgi:hypothetical protein
MQENDIEIPTTAANKSFAQQQTENKYKNEFSTPHS